MNPQNPDTDNAEPVRRFRGASPEQIALIERRRREWEAKEVAPFDKLSYKLRPAQLLTQLILFFEVRARNNARMWKLYGWRETLESRHCMYCGKFDFKGGITDAQRAHEGEYGHHHSGNLTFYMTGGESSYHEACEKRYRLPLRGSGRQ